MIKLHEIIFNINYAATELHILEAQSIKQLLICVFHNIFSYFQISQNILTVYDKLEFSTFGILQVDQKYRFQFFQKHIQMNIFSLSPFLKDEIFCLRHQENHYPERTNTCDEKKGNQIQIRKSMYSLI